MITAKLTPLISGDEVRFKASIMPGALFRFHLTGFSLEPGLSALNRSMATVIRNRGRLPGKSQELESDFLGWKYHLPDQVQGLAAPGLQVGEIFPASRLISSESRDCSPRQCFDR